MIMIMLWVCYHIIINDVQNFQVSSASLPKD